MKECKREKGFALFRVWDLFILLIVLALIAGALYLVFAPQRGSLAEVFMDGK